VKNLGFGVAEPWEGKSQWHTHRKRTRFIQHHNVFIYMN